MRRSGPGEDPATTVVVTYKVLLREGKDGTDYTTDFDLVYRRVDV